MALTDRTIRILVLLALCLGVSACTENLSTNRPYILTTATTGGTYYKDSNCPVSQCHASELDSTR